MRQPVALAAMAAALVTLLLLRTSGAHNAETSLLVVLVVVGLVNFAGEIQAGPRVVPRNGPLAVRARRVLTKLYALAVIYGVLAFGYFLFAGFAKDFVVPILNAMSPLLLPLLIVSPLYVWATDSVQEDPHDELFALGLFVTGQKFDVCWPPILSYLRGWLIKGYFAPLMITSALLSTKAVLSPDLFSTLTSLNVYQSSFRVAGWISITYGALGYLCTLKLAGTHIRSAEPTLFGWVVCIMCYEPFWPAINKSFFPYEDGYYWSSLFSGSSVLWGIWACLIIAAQAGHAWVTASFGMRFSNLTNRGIITSGPYRWMKHPSYVFKLTSYFLISVPFVSTQGGVAALRNCLLLGLIALIYVARAWSEERHLSADPDYVAYSLWMKENSLFAKFRKALRLVTPR